MGFLSLIGTKLFTWALEKAGTYLVNYFKIKTKLSKNARVIDDEVKAIEDIVAVMKARRKAKLPVSEELKKELKNAMAKLSITSNGG